jgi:hypothetical protein
LVETDIIFPFMQTQINSEKILELVSHMLTFGVARCKIDGMATAVSTSYLDIEPPQKSGRPRLDFHSDLKEVARALRSSLSAMMTSVGLNPEDPQSLAKRWGVNYKLSWSIAKVVQTQDAFLSLQYLPGNEGVGILLKKGSDAGVGPQFIEATRQAVSQFDRMIEEHCGDRVTFEIMGSDLSMRGTEAVRQQQEIQRKQLFQGASAVWGARTRVNFKMHFISPSPGCRANAEKVDIAVVGGLIDFRRLRENLPWVLSTRERVQNDGTLQVLQKVEAIDPGSDGDFRPLMRDFCSHPLPQLNIIRNSSSEIAELPPAEIGNAGSLSCVFGSIDRSLPHSWTEIDQTYGYFCRSNVPAELMVFDLYIHESIKFALPPNVFLASQLSNASAGSNEYERYRLPLHEPLLDLGLGSSLASTPEVPKYGEMVEAVFARTHWTPKEFHAFRVRIPYPPLPAMLVMKYALPK